MNMLDTPARVKLGVVVEPADNEFWIRGRDSLNKTADEVMAMIREFEDSGEGIDICAVGAEAVNTAVKVIALVREQLRTKYLKDAVVQPIFCSYLNENEEARNRMILRLMVIG